MAKYLTAPVPSTRIPRGIPYIIGNEFAERFSFYGMKGILVVFMTQYLMTGQGGLDLMSNAEATEKYHLFTAAVYFTPLLGALIADLFFGKYMTIIALSLVYCAGHAVLAYDDTRMGLGLGLGLIALGAGGIKPCVSAHVGDQFGATNQPLISKTFGWFYVSINIGAFLSNLLTPWLLQHPSFGPSWAFGVPGGLMLLATWVFWLGRRKFVHIPPGGMAFVKEVLNVRGLKALGKLSIIYVFVVVFWALFDQTGSTWVLQARSMDREIFGFTVFEAQFQAANPLLILILVPLFTYAVYPAISRFFPLTPLRKISIGLFITVLAFAVPAVIESNITGGRLANMSSQAPRGDWSPWNLIDVDATNGWASARLPAERVAGEPLARIDYRLRERQAWLINSVEINPYVTGVMNDTDPMGDEARTFEDLTRLAKDVSIHVSDSANGPWTQVATIALTQTDAYQPVEFAPVTAAYVRLQVDSHYGGPHVVLSRIRVLSPDSAPPATAAPTATVAWPDVAALGFKPFILWQLLAYILITAAEVMISITCLEFSYTQAPRRMKSFIMALFLVSVSAGNILVAAVNFFIQNDDGTTKLEGASYYWLFTALMLVTALAFMVVVKFYKEQTYIQEEVAVETDPTLA